MSETQTIARRDPESGHFRLYGTKFFTSAVTAQMAMTLARIEGAPAGSRGLSLFYLEPWDTEGKLRNIEVLRLKDKLGTRALPTAELRLNGAPARLVGDEGNGVKKISSLFNITRIYNACVAVTSMQRAIQLARDYAGKRRAFGKLLSEHPLHLETLAAMEAEASAGVQLVFRVAELLGKEETGQATPEESAVLRLLTPLAKLYTGKQAVAVTSEALECFGGAGYMEDTGIPRLLRDAQTLSIWEGTTNVLALDALRAIQKENAFAPFVADVRARLERVRKPLAVLPGVAKAKFALSRIEAYWPSALNEGLDSVQAGARQFAFALARAYMAALLLEQAQWSDKNEDPAQDGAYAVQVALRWCNQELAPLMHKE